jgi:Flp pilus assembly protein TadD
MYMKRLPTFLLLGLITLVSIVVFPIFTNFMVTSKILFFFVTALALLSILVWQILHSQSLEVPKSSLLAPLMVFGLALLASSLFTTRYPVEALLGMGGVYVSLVVVAVAGSILLKKAETTTFTLVTAVTGAVISVLTLLQTAGFGPSRFINAAFGLDMPHTSLFNVVGSPFVAAQVLGAILLGLLATFFVRRKLSRTELISLPLIVLGLAVSIWVALPGKQASPLLLPFGVSWSVAVDVMKSPRSALIGVGPENFSVAYAQFRPNWTNNTPWWSNLFGQGFNTPLTLLATSGLLSLLAWLWVVIAFLNQAKRELKTEPFVTGLLAGTFIAQLLFPSNVVLLAFQAVALAYFISSRQTGKTLVHFFKTVSFEFGSTSTRSALSTFVPIIIAAGAFLLGVYGIGRAYAASNYLFRSAVAAQKNEAVETYQLQLKARNMNPYVGVYRTNFATTNLAIASALASKTDLTEQERQQVAQLIQQAITEAKAATVLRPEDTQSWRLLGQIYRNLIGSAESADQWTINSYVKAIELHPTDPSLRLELGSIFYSGQKYNEAALLFQQATELKPDYVNAYYNLANALKQTNQLEQAKVAYQKTLALLPADSEDYIKANGELAEVEKAIAAQGSGAAGTGTSQAAPNSASTSLLNQNLTQSEQTVVNQPANDDLNVSEPSDAAGTASPTPITTTSPSPAAPVVSPSPTL